MPTTNLGLTFTDPRSLRVGLPLEEINKTLDTLQEKYSTAQSNANELEIAMANLKVSAGDEPEKQNEIVKLQTQLQDITEKGDYENLGYQIQNTMKDFATNNKLRAMVENRKLQDQEDAAIQQLKISGETPLVFSQDRNTFKTINEDGSLNYYKPDYEALLRGEQGYDAVGSKIWETVLPDAVASGLLTTQEAEDIKSGKAVYVTDQVFRETNTGISQSKIQNLTDMAFNRMKTYGSYNQMFRKRMELDKELQDEKDPAARAQLLEARMKDEFQGAGLMRTYNVQKYEGGVDEYKARTALAAKQAEAEVKKKEAEMAAKVLVGLQGDVIINPRNISGTYSELRNNYLSSQNLYDTYNDVVTKKQQYIASNPNLPQEDIDKAEQEINEYKIKRDVALKTAEDYEKIMQEDYIEFLRNPVDQYGNPTTLNSSTGKLTDLQALGSEYFEATMGEDGLVFENKVTGINSLQDSRRNYLNEVPGSRGAIENITVKFGTGNYAQNSKYFELERKKNKTVGKEVTINSKEEQEKLITKLLDVANNVVGYKIPSGTNKGMIPTSPGASALVDVVTSESVEGLLVKELTALSDAGLIAIDKDSVKQVAKDLLPVTSALEATTNMQKVLNTEKYQEQFLEAVSTQNYNPTIYDFSTSSTDATKSSKVSSDLSQIVSNNMYGMAYFKDGVPYTPVNGTIKNVEVTGITEFVPGQGYLLAGKINRVVPIGNNKTQEISETVYMKPTTTMLDSGITSLVTTALVGNGTQYVGQMNRAIELATQIQQEFIDNQFDRFRSVPISPNQNITSKVVVDEDYQFMANRTTDRFGSTKYSLDYITNEGSKETFEFNNLETMINKLEVMGVQRKNLNDPALLSAGDVEELQTYSKDIKVNPEFIQTAQSLELPEYVDDSIGGELFNFVSLDSREPVVNGMYRGVKVTVSDRKDANGNTMLDFGDPANGLLAAEKKAIGLYNPVKNSPYQKTNTLNELSNTYVGVNNTGMIRTLKELFYPDKSVEELSKLNYKEEIPLPYLLHAIVKSEVTNGVYEKYFKPLMKVRYGV